MTDISEKEITLRNEEVNEILSSPPKWIIRWGISIVFFVILLGLFLSFVVRYPETLTAKAVITTLNPSVTLIAKANGKLTHLLVVNNEVVSKETILGIIENIANHIQVLNLEKNIDLLNYQLTTMDNLAPIFLSDNLRLGDITPQYLTFLKNYKEYKLFTEINPQLQEIKMLNKELAEYNILLSNYQKQETLVQEECNLVEKDYYRDLELYSQKVISTREFETKKKEYLNAQRNFQNLKITTSNTKITVSTIEKNKIQLQMQEYKERSKYKQEIEQAIKSLQTAIVTWKNNYLLQSPIDGKVSFFNYWTKNQNIKAGDAVFSIVPTEQQEIIAKLILPSQNSGKVKPGQKVNIKLDNYPYTEYGMLTGVIKNISLVPSNNTYAIDVKLTKGLTTSYNKTLDYKSEINGIGDIITDNLSIIDRVIIKFKKIVVK